MRLKARTDSNRRDDRRDILVTKATISGADAPEAEKAKSVWLFNISEGGVGFRGNQSLTPGSIHHIKVEAGPFQLEKKIRIAWSRKRDDNTMEAGGQFLLDEDGETGT